MIDSDRIGMWDYHLNYHDVHQAKDWLAEFEDLGLASFWTGEAFFREPFATAGLILSATKKIMVATGIASIWSRDAFATVAAQVTLAEAYPQRFLLGIGVSHPVLVDSIRGHRYDKPLTAMTSYLDAMDASWKAYQAIKPATRPPHVLAALGPHMMALAAERAAGAHTYLVPPEHTQRSREILGAEPLLVPEQAVVLDTDVQRARALARSHIRRYLPLPNYVGNLRRLGFTDDDFADSGSDRLVDAIVAHGDVADIDRRVRAHRSAGASHVCLHVLSPTRHRFPAPQWRTLLTSM